MWIPIEQPVSRHSDGDLPAVDRAGDRRRVIRVDREVGAVGRRHGEDAGAGTPANVPG